MTIAARGTVSLIAAGVLGLTATAPTAAAAPRGTGANIAPTVVDPSGDYLPRAAQGRAAVERLSTDLDEVAALNDMTTGELKRLLLEDDSVWVHPTGRLFYVDPAPTEITSTPTASAPYPYADTFELHSNPGSSRTIYLDFDGHTVAGTGWNEYDDFLLGVLTHPAYSLDGDRSTFSNAERDAIQSVWQRVSEDYAPFDVDVTTEDPGPEALHRSSSGDSVFGSRAVITPSQAAAGALCDDLCGGIAFMGTFAETESHYFQPAWIFPHLLGSDTKAIAEAVTHEVGHNLGLDHDGYPGDAYYPGHGSWAPIMGGAYDRPISQWSKGEYDGANNDEDDLTVITQNGLSYVPDDHGNTRAAATPLTTGTTAGLVSTTGDQDYFSLSGCTGPTTVSVVPAPTSPNLDVRLRLLSGDGTVLAVHDPRSGSSSYDVATGMGATASVDATGAPVYIEVDGVGAGSPATNGYSEYASLGRYTLTAPVCAGQEGTEFQPDLLISAGKRAGYAGDDVYNLDGAQQTLDLGARRDRVRTFFVRVVNDGSSTDEISLAGAKAGKGAKVVYSNQGTDITRWMAEGTAVAELPAGGYANIRVDVIIARRTPVGSVKSVTVTASSADGSRSDLVRSFITVKP